MLFEDPPNSPWGIGELATRGDLLDRSIILDLPQIENKDRIPESEFNECLERELPKIDEKY